MAYRISNWRRMLVNLKNSIFITKQKDVFVGSDKYGNQYFERKGDTSRNIRSSRYIQEKVSTEASEIPEVPVEWNAWLRGLKKDPPTPEEIEKNYITMMKTKFRASELDKKFATKEHPESTTGSTTGSTITEDIKSNLEHNPFPKYDDLEKTPGELFSKQSKSKN
uniref:NADH dehydrogenase [ubiquinone] 1 alpha subcomplex assembly factor 2 n=2 Tax=Arion vulgaris TaxID=1028688 RepID=A0A0B7BBR0_9EUPU